MEFELFNDCAEDDYGFGAEDIDNEQEQVVFEGDEGQRCGICMDVVVDRGVLDCCQHWFCFSCIDNWATITNLCPLCQGEFQLITCVPVYDTIGSIQPDDESYSRDDDEWSIEGNSNTVSFPSYYIDENAVSCLEGDSCKIRGQSANLEEDPDLDTSIACDSCDLWYHAICVGFDTEGSCETSWLCPKCLIDETSQKSEAGPSSKYEQLGDVNFPMNVSVSVADAGETAVVVSMVDGNQQTKVQDENMLSSVNIINDIKIDSNSFLLSEWNQENEEMNQIMLQESRVSEDMEINKTNSDDFNNHNLENNFSEKITKKPKLEPIEEEEDLPLSNFKEETTVSDELPSSDINPNKKIKTSGTTAGKRKQRDLRYEEVGAKIKKSTKTERNHAIATHDSKTPNKKPRVETDIRDIVQGPYRKSSEDKGVRVKKIMRRPTPTDNKDSLLLVQNLRKEIRDAVRNRSSKETTDNNNNSNNNNVFDPNLLAAFRAALTGQTDAKRPQLPLNMKAKKSLLQKGTVRENLTKKIYGVGGKRKRAWTRDAEIEFWKHRCSKVSKPEKIETLKSVLDLLRKDPEVFVKKENIQNTEITPGEGSILSRLYVADSSVFPRKDDIKPLSVVKFPEVEPKLVPKVKPNCLGDKESKGKKVNVTKSGDRSSSSVMSDGKVDKKKWALEVLARKTAVVGNSNNSTQGQDNVVLKGNYPLLGKLPVEMRPSLATSRHNKIPISVRQAQLYRLTEHFLKKTNMPISSTHPSAEIELAVADAINVEKSVADKSNSKLVYINLCSQELSSLKSDTITHSEPLPDKSEPPPPPPTTTSADVDVNEALKNTGLLSDSDSDHETDNVLEMDSHSQEDVDIDIYGDFEYDLEEDIGVNSIKTFENNKVKEDTKIKMVFSTSDWRFEENEDDEKEKEKEKVDELEELYGPDKEPIMIKYPEIKPIDLVPENNIVAEVSNGSCSENIVVTDGGTDLPKKTVQKKVETKEKKTQSDDKKQQSEKHTSVFKKVEAYIKEHIRPLCKSGVITVDQYRWAVGKTTDKIMKFHSKDTNANFLIKEGEKVKKLAEQYVEAAQKVEK
ncbi:hypothetical protein LXL04_005746 [Taraxacum kok-saghyz]